MATGRKIIKKALQKAKIITKNESPSADEINDGLDALNAMVSSWANESLLVFHRPKETFTLSGGIKSYTIGVGGDFDTVRPVQILSARVSVGEVVYENLYIENDTNFQTYEISLDTTGTPIYLNYNNNYPLGTITLYPKPSIDYDIELISEKPLTEFTLDDDVALPPGWERALIYNLADEVASEYGQALNPNDVKIAIKALSSIKIAVAKNTSLDIVPMGTTEAFSVYRGW